MEHYCCDHCNQNFLLTIEEVKLLITVLDAFATDQPPLERVDVTLMWNIYSLLMAYRDAKIHHTPTKCVKFI